MGACDESFVFNLNVLEFYHILNRRRSLVDAFYCGFQFSRFTFFGGSFAHCFYFPDSPRSK
jgi:hypothetical protein